MSLETAESRVDRLAGKVIANGKYQLIRRIGKGAMGSVYLARQIGTERPVAIKFASIEDNPQIRARFLDEVRATASLNHPNIVTIYDSGEETFNPGTPDQRDYPYMVMECLEGLSLDEYIERRGTVPVNHGKLACKALSSELIVKIFSQLCAAMAALGDAGIVHRDLKPENVFVCENGSDIRVKILDLGIARRTADASVPSGATVIEREKTVAGAIIGSVHCMAPEQFRSSLVDMRADMYAMACILYCLCMGICPHEDSPEHNGSVMFWIGVHGSGTPPTPIRERRPDLPPRFARIVAKGLSPRPGDRFQTASEFLLPFTNPHLMSDEDTPAEGLRLETETIPPPAPHRRSSSIILRASVYTSLFIICAAIMLLLLSRLAGTGRDHPPPPQLNVAITPIPPSPSFTDGGVVPIDRPTATDRPVRDSDVPHLDVPSFRDGGTSYADVDRPDRPRRPVVRRRRCPPPVIINGVIVSPPCEP